MQDSRAVTYGRMVIFGSWLAIFCIFGFRATFAILQGPMIKGLQWDATQVTLGYSIMMLCYAITSFFCGYSVDKWGTRPVFALGAIFGALGFGLTSKATTLTEYYIYYGVLGGICTGFLWVSATVAIRKWYVGKTYGKSYAVAFMGGPFAQLVLGWIVRKILLSGAAAGETDTWRYCMLILAAVTFVALIVAAIVSRKTPDAYGLKPFGEMPQPAGGPKPYIWSLGEAFRTWAVWGAVLGFLIGMLSEFLIWTQIVRYWTTDHGMEQGAAMQMFLTIGAVGIFSIPLMGVVGDKIVTSLGNEIKGRKVNLMMAGCIGALASAVLLLQHQGGPVLGYVACVLFAFFWGITPGNTVGYLGAVFGRATIGKIWGLCTLIVMGVGPFLGPIIAARLFDAYKSYDYAIAVALGCFVACALISATLPNNPLTPREKPAENA